MHKIKQLIKATIIELIVALFITAILLGIGYFLFGAKIEETMSLKSKVSIGVSDSSEVVNTVIDNKKIKNYPEYGTKYAKNGGKRCRYVALKTVFRSIEYIRFLN